MQVRQFCQASNIGELIQYLVIDDGILSQQEHKQLVAELVRAMINLTADFGGAQENQEIEIDVSMYSKLISKILESFESGKIPLQDQIRLANRVNCTIFQFAEADVKTEWIKYSSG